MKTEMKTLFKSNILQWAMALVLCFWAGTMMAQTYQVGSVVTTAEGETGVLCYINDDHTSGWMVALRDASTSCVWSNQTGNAGIGMTLTTGTNWLGYRSVITNFDGQSATMQMRAAGDSASYPAAYTVDLEHHWYLPTIGQLNLIYSYRSILASSFVNAGGTPISGTSGHRYWSSSQSSVSQAWCLYMPSGQISTMAKTGAYRIREVCDVVFVNGVAHSGSPISGTITTATNNNQMGVTLGDGTYPGGTQIMVSAVSYPGFKFVGWNDQVTTNPRPVTVDGNAHFDATFAVNDDSVAVIYDTLIEERLIVDTAYVHDTTTITLYDSLFVVDTVMDWQYDTIFADRWIYDTTFVVEHDTTFINHYIHDTAFVNNYIHDTAIIIRNVIDTFYINQNFHDTVLNIVNHYIHDTVFVNHYFHDTVSYFLNHYIHDTAFVNHYIYDTAFINHYIHDTTFVNTFIYDTAYLWRHDTTFVNNFIHDTAFINHYIHDTIFVNNYIHDTAFLWRYDTIVRTLYPDSYAIHVISGNNNMGIAVGNGLFPEGCTIEIGAIPLEGYRFVRWNDGNTDNPRQITVDGSTTYVASFEQNVAEISSLSEIGVEILTEGDFITVQGAQGQTIRIFDTLGRRLAVQSNASATQTFHVPATGAYMVQVGNLPAKKVVVVR